MNIASIAVKMMISTTATWLESESFRKQLVELGPLGQGILAELESAHLFLADLANRRKQANAKLRALIDRIIELDGVHDRKARGIYFALDSLIQLASSAEQAKSHEQLKQLLFPHGLRIVSMTHLEESGGVEELELAVGAEVREDLAKLQIGDTNLGAALSEWIAAGKALGVAVAERETLKASLKNKGSSADKIDLRVGRGRWLEAVRGLLWLLEVKQREASALAEPVEAALNHAITLSLRQRNRAKDATGGTGDGADTDEGPSDALDEPEDQGGEAEPSAAAGEVEESI